MRILYSLAVLILFAAPLAAQPVQAPHVTVELVSDRVAIQKGQPFRVGLLFNLEEHWHTYWRNPGDAGLAPTFELNVPDGYIVSDIEWPFPQAFGEAPDVSYGYHGNVLLPVTITPPLDAVGDSVTIAARASWLVCNELCIPGKAELAVTVALRDEAVESERIGWFDEAERNFARKAGKINITARREGAEYVMIVANAPERPGRLPNDVQFYPYDEGVVDHSGVQSIEYTDRVFQLRVPVSPYEAERPKSLRGLLVTKATAWNGDHLRAIIVDAEIVDDSSPASTK